VLFALPLLICYEVLAAAMNAPGGAGVRNGADVLIKAPFVALFGARGTTYFGVLLVAVCASLVIFDKRRHPGPMRFGVFLGMLVESVVLALVFGVVVGTVTANLLRPFAMPPQATLPLDTRLMVSLGAGLYEELLFRVVLVGALVAGARRILGLRAPLAKVVAVILGALVFAAFHYVGRYGDPLKLDSFLFRTVGGLAFSALYVTRGFGITAWTHALYDVFLLLA
jgi:hypothetical protein